MLKVDVRKRLASAGKDDFCLSVAFEVGSGFTVLSGPSGAGKTTTLKLIAGIVSPDDGLISLNENAYFDSANGTDLPIQDRQVGFVFQDYALFPHFTALQNVAYGIRASNRTERDERAKEMLNLFKIEKLYNRRPREMSGGEQQRVALARALAADPAIVLLDEPLSAVDVKTRSKLLDEIELAQQRIDIPFIYVTHNADEAARLGKFHVTLDNGSVV